MSALSNRTWSRAAKSALAIASAVSLCWAPAAALAGNTGTPTKTTTAQLDNPLPISPFFHPTDKAFVSKFLHTGQYMPVSELKPGMVGYGLTVFHGTKVERFNVQIISVVKKILNGRDAILARLSGGGMGTNCVIKGMSGSPCYINGKLIGAVSFGFDFEKEPIAGITPIVDMLDALAEPAPGSKPSIAHLSAPSWAVPERDTNGVINTSSGAPRLIPLMSPVSLVGFSPRAESFLADKFKDIGLGVSAGASGALDPQLANITDKEIRPGSALSVMLATGDFNIAATGTATARFGDKVVAFGHPFMQGGSIDFPMATAYVHQVMPSLSASFKMASPVSLVGSITNDRPWGIGGHMGRSSHMIPASYTVVDETRHIERTYHCEVVDHPEMTPEILSATATSAIDATHQATGPYVAKVESRIEAEGIDPIIRTDRFATGLAPKTFFDMLSGGDPVGRYVQRTTDEICNNDFQKAAIKSINLRITIQDGHQTAKIDRVYIDKPYVAPGEDVKLTAVIKPFNREAVEETMTLHIPRDIPDGNLVIGVAGGQDYDLMKSRLGIVEPEAENVKQIARRIQAEGRGDQIALVVALPEQSLMVDGTKLVNPPAYWTKVFVSNRHTKGPSLVRGELKQTRDEDWMLFGSHIIAVEVRSPDKAEARTAPYPLATPTNNDDLSITEQARKAMESIPSVNRRMPGGQHIIAIPGVAQIVPGMPIVAGVPPAAPGSNGTGNATTSSTKSVTSSLTAAIGKEYPHGRPLQIWRLDSDDEFRAGKFDDSTVDSWGRISPGFESVAEKPITSVDQVWASAWSNGSVYYGAGDELWRWNGNQNQPEKVAHLDGLFIPALTADSNGIVYAASVPSGHIWSLDTRNANSKPHICFTASDPIITSLAVDDKDTVYAGAAGSGKVYRIDAAKHSSVLLDSQQAHALCLFYDQLEHKLYIGTGEKGSVYSVDAEGKVQVVYQSPDHFVTGVVKDKKGDLYVASAGQGHLVRVSPSGEPTTLATSEAFYTLHYDANTDSVFSGDAEGDITMACLDPLTHQPYFMPICHTEQEAVIALASNGTTLYAGTSNLAGLRAFRMQLSSKPLYTSAVKDAGRTSQWSHLHAYGPFNEVSKDLNAKLAIETRSGETSKPDETWSAWQKAIAQDDSFAIASPPGRYFQWKLSWNTSGDKFSTEKVDRLTLGRIDTTYLPDNSAPQISHISVKSSSALSGKQQLSLTGTDADGDNLLASIDISSDGGATWKPLKDDIRSKSAKSSSKGTDDGDEDKDKDKDKNKDGTQTGDSSSSGGAAVKDEKTSTKDGDSATDSAKDKNDGKGGDADAPKEANPDKAPDKGTSEPPKEDAPKSNSAYNSDQQRADLDSSIPVGTQTKKVKGAGSHKTANQHGEKKKTKTTAHAAAEADSGSDTKSSEGPGPTTESFEYKWDTKTQKDGNYLLRFTVDDRLSNPAHSQDVVNLRSVVVDNTPPEIQLIDCKHLPDGKLEFKVTAQDKVTAVANATYKLDDGEPFAFSFTPDSIDGLNAVLLATEVKVPAGSHKLEVKVSDRAGNTATKTVTIK